MEYSATHTLLFNNVFTDIFCGCPSFYIPSFRYFFDKQMSIILTGEYWMLCSLVANNFYNYIRTEALTLYDEAVTYLKQEDDSVGLTEVDETIYFYLKYNPDTVIDNLTAMCRETICNFTHHIHNYVETARTHHMGFSSIECRYGYDNPTVVVQCYLNEETVKRYDRDLYDRMSLLF